MRCEKASPSSPRFVLGYAEAGKRVYDNTKLDAGRTVRCSIFARLGRTHWGESFRRALTGELQAQLHVCPRAFWQMPTIDVSTVHEHIMFGGRERPAAAPPVAKAAAPPAAAARERAEFAAKARAMLNRRSYPRRQKLD